MSQDGGSVDGAVTVDRDGAVLRLTLNRPARRNALSHSMVDALVDALTDAAVDDSLRAIHIRGHGDDFCAGADWLAANSGEHRPRTGDLIRRIPHTSHRLIELVAAIHLPVVCAVRGWAVGLGCNLALAADFTVAAENAVFWEPVLSRGFSPDSGSTWLLPRRSACPTRLGSDGGTRAGEAGHSPRPERNAVAGDEPGALQSGAVLSNKRFQRSSGRIPGATHTGVPRPMTNARPEEGKTDGR